jgi:hypothetical protein
MVSVIRREVVNTASACATTDYAGNKNNNTFKAFVIALPISLGYTLFNNKNIAVALSGGGSALYLGNNTFKTVRESGAPVRQPDYSAKLTYNFFGEGELACKRKIAFYAGCYFPCPLGNYTLYRVLHSSVKFGLRYYFR